MHGQQNIKFIDFTAHWWKEAPLKSFHCPLMEGGTTQIISLPTDGRRHHSNQFTTHWWKEAPLKSFHYPLMEGGTTQIISLPTDGRRHHSNHFFFLWRCDPTWVMASSFLRFLDYTRRRTTVGRTPLDEWSARHRGLYLTAHNTHNRQTPMPLMGFEPTISAGERPQTYALDHAATGIGT